MLRNDLEGQGFSIIPSILSSEEVAEFCAAMVEEPLPRSRAGIRHALKNSTVSELANSPKLLEISKSILGHAAVPFRATVFDKSAASNWLVVWHQDTALPLQDRRESPGWGPWSIKDGVHYAHAPASALSKVLALRVHLDDSTAQNGPLRVLPGTHLRGVLSDHAVHELVKHVSPVDCQVSMGGILAMRPLLVHSSSKSIMKIPRRVLHIEYAPCLNVDRDLNLAIA
jgi:ectoine hydroxylase-related dioxygenase (phytanoyl-CoA dioxygenase family)